jgi:hypothetical protein
VTKYELLKYKVDEAYTEWLRRPYGLGRAVHYLRYLYLKHKLDFTPVCEAEKKLRRCREGDNYECCDKSGS